MIREDLPPLKLVYCYARKDQKLRDALDSHLSVLRRSGAIITWHDAQIIPGTSWEQEIHVHLNSSQIILLLISAYFIASDYCYSQEMLRALERHRAGNAHVVPVILRPVDWHDTPFSHIQALPTNALPITKWRNKDEAFKSVADGIYRVVSEHRAQYITMDIPKANSASDEKSAVQDNVIATPVPCPYQGLDVFTEKESQYFFGRERDIERLLDRLRSDMRFLAVLGPSGSGKSSLVRAGLLHRLQRGALQDSRHWDMIVIRPADDPWQGLAASGITGEAQSLKSGAQKWLDEHLQCTRLVFIIDQFEELLVTCSEKIRRNFIEQILQLLQSNLVITVIVIMRDDFYGQIVQYDVLARDWFEQRVVNISKTLRQAEVADIVQKPAEAVGLGFEEGLVDIIVQNTLENKPDLANEGRAARSTILPLLEFALKELWERCYQQGMLKREAYEAIGGVTGGLTQWADKVFYALEEKEERPEARRIFTALVYLGDENQGRPDSRRRLPLAAFVRHDRDIDMTHRVIRRLVNSKLLVTAYDRQSQQEVVEIIHDALLWEWGEMRRWLHKDREFLVWHQEFDRQARAWEATNIAHVARRDTYKLLRGSDLQVAQRWKNEHADDLSQVELDFIEASQKLGARRKLLLMAGGLVSLGLAATGGTLEVLSLISRYVNIALYSGQKSSIWSIAWSADGKRIASAPGGGRDFGVQVWYATTALYEYKYTGHKRSVTSVAWSANNYRIASGSMDQTVQVWSSDSIVHPPQTYPPYIYNKHTDLVLTVAWSPNGKYLASGAAGNDRTVHVWHADPDTIGNLIYKYTGHTDAVDVVAWSPDSVYIASGGGDNTVQVWEAMTGKLLYTYKGHTSHVLSVAWSPDGRYIASAGFDQTVQIWSPSTGKHFYTYTDHNKVVNAVAWSPDGEYIASAGVDQTVQVWEAQNGNPICRYEEHHSEVRSVAWSPSKETKMLASAGDDKRVHVWKLK